ncbi:MAG: hypothetical protein LBP33_02680 [Candidatus Adiutrix sp.]|jgi:CheY-like chemotaxis protein|nr:hypothetical protein [Candidatus Adiutrix sp.]
MQLECYQCHRLLNLPDEKLPVGRHFSFTCPYCKNKNGAFIPAPEQMPEQSPEQMPEDGPYQGQWPPAESPPAPGWGEEGQAPPADQNWGPYQQAEYQPPPPPPAPDSSYLPVDPPRPDSGLEGLDGDQNTLQALMSGAIDERPKALVVYDDEETSKMLIDKLESMGFQTTMAVNLRDAAKQLKFSDFSLLLLQEDYYGATLNSNQLLRSIQSLDNHSRLKMLVVLISPTLTTLDDLLAFSLSLDAIINSGELAAVDRFLISIIARARKFYSIYRELLTEHGLD